MKTFLKYLFGLIFSGGIAISISIIININIQNCECPHCPKDCLEQEPKAVFISKTKIPYPKMILVAVRYEHEAINIVNKLSRKGFNNVGYFLLTDCYTPNNKNRGKYQVYIGFYNRKDAQKHLSRIKNMYGDASIETTPRICR